MFFFVLFFFIDTDYLLFRKYGPVALIGLNRPSKRNALNEAMIKDLANTITEIENDDSIAIGVIHGEGGNFCSGYDLEELAENDKIPQTFIFNVKSSYQFGVILYLLFNLIPQYKVFYNICIYFVLQ